MKYVILRDDDTNAFTPVEYLERLFRPFLNRGMPVNLATIPNVTRHAQEADGRPEQFLMAANNKTEENTPIARNHKLVTYLKENSGFHILQHGYQHSYFEFDQNNRRDLINCLEKGTELLMEAGFPKPVTFVAPYDQLSKTSLVEVAKRFRVLSTGWFQLNKLPLSWWPQYVLKKKRKTPHWRIGSTLLLSHPGCLLSCHKPFDTMLNQIKQSIDSRRLTVLVSHWWEYFRDNTPNEEHIGVLHEVAAYLASRNDLQVISFDDLAREKISLN
ncbi:MAG: DUF2334 domain-containing protein [Verrucomicrobiota bacterium]|nr:DUF2334 domain-containing protein [Verrucomicrobiota bacterium]